jgi:hypothetical protein
MHSWERVRRDKEIRLYAKEMGCCDALDGFPEDWMPYTFLLAQERDPHTLELVLEGYREGYAEGSKPLPF